MDRLKIADITNREGLIYQPLPFKEYESLNIQRKDCKERYQIIKNDYGDFKNKTLIDICCANGYFLFKFMQDGGKLARGIEIRREIVNFVNLLAIEKEMDVSCNFHLNGLKNLKFDIGIYLDTHYAPGTEGYLEWLHKHTKVLYTSCASGEDGISRNEEYKKLLSGIYQNDPIFICEGFMGRIIYKCELQSTR